MACPDDAGHGWMRAACAVHEQERRLRAFIGDTYRATDALVVRMQLLGYGRARDGVLAALIRVRDRLALEASRSPLLLSWQATFDDLARLEGDLDPATDEALARELEASGPPEASAHQLALHFPG